MWKFLRIIQKPLHIFAIPLYNYKHDDQVRSNRQSNSKAPGNRGGGVTLLTSAFAGHYVAGTTSGLTATVSMGGMNGPTFGNGSASASGGGGGSASVGGTISTTYTWTADGPNDNEPPPLSVVVLESCSVSMSAQAFPGSTSAAANNGLDARFCTNTSTSNVPIYYPIPVPPYQYQIGSGSGAYSAGTAARVLGGGQSITVQCSPTGSCASSNGPLSVSVSYSAQVYPVRVSVAGTIDWMGAKAALVGRVLQPSYSAGAPGVSVKPATISWSISGAIFKSFYVSPDQSQGHEVTLTSPINEVSPTYCYKDNAQSEVKATATLSYGGYDIGEASAKKQVVAVKPSSVLTFLCQGNGYTTDSYIYSSSGGIDGLAIILRFQTYIPSSFAFLSDYGWNGICQLISNDRRIYPQNVFISNYKALDNHFPYDDWYPGRLVGMSQVSNWTGDAPSQEFYTTTTKVEIQDQFHDWLMFQPPAGQPVALRSTNGVSWVWGALSERVNGSMEQFANVISSSGTSSESPEFPSWTSKFSNIE